MSQFGNITKEQARALYAALRRHDGPSMVPGLNRNQAKELTAALDALRGILLEIIDGSEAGRDAARDMRPWRLRFGRWLRCCFWAHSGI